MHDLNEIIDGGYCIGCGACAFVGKGSIDLIEDEYRQYQGRIQPEAKDMDLDAALAVCPFSNEGPNEDEISQRVFDYESGSYAEVVGYHKALYAGHVSDTGLRKKVTSGGILTYTLSELLKRDLVDAVVHVKKSDKSGTLFEYGFSRTPEEVVQGAKSRYYPIEISEVMDFIKNNEGRYAFVGIPCFIKTVRRLCGQDEILAERIHFFVGLVCGHLKSKAYADLMAWRAGFNPDEMKAIDFRHKFEDRNADDYGICVEDLHGNKKELVARETPGTNWGLGFFKYEACDYCDDIFAETADIAVGDAWLKDYTNDSLGNSVVVVRNETIQSIIDDGMKSGTLAFDELTAEEALMSQGGGFRHRRTGLGDRLYLKQKRTAWVPKKRVDAVDSGIPLLRKLIYRYRIYLRERSAVVWKDCRRAGNYSTFDRRMKWPTRGYSLLLKVGGIVRRLKQRVEK
ncbi:Coenzyme F420 hydrogenase/dehydrogenase, beta subunit C-terminal domain [Pontiellaceae bacterium B12219]|nr:Coenzyme F420 hydrogenase/dehydrogenase, beta subunit C-terminal domain [Pontiellaceae bacterium B12219]